MIVSLVFRRCLLPVCSVRLHVRNSGNKERPVRSGNEFRGRLCGNARNEISLPSPRLQRRFGCSSSRLPCGSFQGWISGATGRGKPPECGERCDSRHLLCVAGLTSSHPSGERNTIFLRQDIEIPPVMGYDGDWHQGESMLALRHQDWSFAVTGHRADTGLTPTMFAPHNAEREAAHGICSNAMPVLRLQLLYQCLVSN